MNLPAHIPITYIIAYSLIAQQLTFHVNDLHKLKREDTYAFRLRGYVNLQFQED